MATILVLNGVAVVGLLALLAATLRLPYHLPTSPQSGVAGREDRLRRRQTSTASEGSRRERGAPEPAYSE